MLEAEITVRFVLLSRSLEAHSAESLSMQMGRKVTIDQRRLASTSASLVSAGVSEAAFFFIEKNDFIPGLSSTECSCQTTSSIFI